jgi:hypothetical protein
MAEVTHCAVPSTVLQSLPDFFRFLLLPYGREILVFSGPAPIYDCESRWILNRVHASLERGFSAQGNSFGWLIARRKLSHLGGQVLVEYSRHELAIIIEGGVNFLTININGFGDIENRECRGERNEDILVS